MKKRPFGWVASLHLYGDGGVGLTIRNILWMLFFRRSLISAYSHVYQRTSPASVD
jgi:hypothetical protein